MSCNADVARKGLVVSGSSLVMLSYCLCIVITVAEGTYIGGLTFPYFSDTGREGTSYFVFASLNTVASLLLMAFMPLQYQYVASFELVQVRCLNTVATVAGFLAPIFSITLSVVSSNQSAEIHAYSAYAFFAGMLIHLLASFGVYWKLAATYEPHEKLKIPRTIVLFVFFVGFLLYLPVGLAVVCNFLRLTFDDCVQVENLGQAYCESVVKTDNANLTVLFDYSNCVPENHLRSSTQFVTIVSLMTYLVLHIGDPVSGKVSSAP